MSGLTRASPGQTKTPSHMNVAGGNPLDENAIPADSATGRRYVLEHVNIGIVDALAPAIQVTRYRNHAASAVYFETRVGLNLENGHGEPIRLGIALPSGLNLASVGTSPECFTSCYGYGYTPTARPPNGYFAGGPGPSHPITGAAPTLIGTNFSYENYCIISTNPDGSLAPGVANVNRVTLAPAGRPVMLHSILQLSETDDGTAALNRHYRGFLFDGDGVDRETFGYSKTLGGGHFGGAAGAYAYEHPAGNLYHYGVKGNNGLQVALQSFINGGHFACVVMYQLLGSQQVNEYGQTVWK